MYKNMATRRIILCFLATFMVLVLFLIYYVSRQNNDYINEKRFSLLQHRLDFLEANIQSNAIHGMTVGINRVKVNTSKATGMGSSTVMRSTERVNDIDESCHKEAFSKIFSVINITDVNKEEMEWKVEQYCLHGETKQCEPRALVGRLEVRTDVVTEKFIYKKELQFVRYGGWWSPDNCNSKPTVAILIPFRGREEHLPVLLRQLHPLLKRQQLHYRIFVVEQDDKDAFNKGKLINAGFLEIQRIFPYSCFVFQDVDLVPEDDRVDYSCKYSPMHMAVAVSTLNYHLFSEKMFGGVVSFAADDYEKVNGFSNLFWVWGGEDDNLYERALLHGKKPHRENITIARYTMLKHVSREKTRSKKEYEEMKKSMRMAIRHAKEDGLNSISYHVTKIKREKLYTIIKIDLMKSADKIFV